jgi:hypothetical protein
MSEQCSHMASIRKVKPSARGCEECLTQSEPKEIQNWLWEQK